MAKLTTAEVTAALRARACLAYFEVNNNTPYWVFIEMEDIDGNYHQLHYNMEYWFWRDTDIQNPTPLELVEYWMKDAASNVHTILISRDGKVSWSYDGIGEVSLNGDYLRVKFPEREERGFGYRIVHIPTGKACDVPYEEYEEDCIKEYIFG